MSQFSRKRTSYQMAFLRNQFGQAEGLPFSDILSGEVVTQALQASEVDDNERVFTAPILFWLFLSQVLSADPSCRAAVARLIAHRVANGEEPCSAETGGYCQARSRMPEAVFAECVRQTGHALESQVSEEWCWHGRHVKIVDGTTCSMPDTEENQSDYPQMANQKPGLGFPIMRLLVVFSLAVGTVLDMRFARYAGKYQSELGMLRQLWDLFCPNDVVLADRYLCSWFEIAILAQNGVDVVMRMHHARDFNFRRGKHLGSGDHIVTWSKPPHRPSWMDKETYKTLPSELVMREIRVKIKQKGFRDSEVIVATTLVDGDDYPASEIGDLYRARWNAELDLRSLKETMQMDVLRGKTPDMVRKEIWVHGLAYNLIRTIMAQAAQKHDLLPREISFKGTIQTLHAFQPRMVGLSRSQFHRYIEILWETIASHRVADRPDRYEPRAVKRRPKPIRLLTVPRQEARKALINNK